MDVFALDECEPDLAAVVGGKAVGLGSLIREQLLVPPGFALPTSAYREFVAERGLAREIRTSLADSFEGQADAAFRIGALFEQRELPQRWRDALARAYRELGEPPVAVRSSAIGEDAPEASFAGEHETFLWVQGVDALARAVVRCWASLFTPQALAYFRRLGAGPAEAAMGVVVQEMVPAEAAGVLFTLDPMTGDPSQITIEGSFGLGAAVVAGEVTPDRWAVDKVTLELRSRTLARKHVAYRFDPEAGEVRAREVPADEQGLPCLADAEVVELAALGKRVERVLGAPQDVEWAVGPGRQVHLLQTRSETVWSRRPRPAGARSAATHGLAQAMQRRG